MSNNKLTLLISASYVGLGTLYAFYAMDNMVSDGFLYYFFLPTNFLAQIIIFTDRSPFLWLLVSQLFTLGIIYFLLWGLVFAIRSEKK